jgi:adenylate cyclase
MADLIAQGTETRHRWRRALPAGQPVVLGRDSPPYAAPWDSQISRAHAELCWRHGRLEVRKFDASPNPIFVRGNPQLKFSIRPGEHFVIGQTTFTLSDDRVQVSLSVRQPVEERAFSAEYLQQAQFRNARARIDVLVRLPEIISNAASDRELFVRLINILLAGVPTADAAALVRVPCGGDTADAAIEVLHWDRHLYTGGDFQPSEQLIRTAIDREESLLHVWSGTGAAAYTARDDVDWAFCTPVSGDACRGWAFYVAGSFARSDSNPALPVDPTDLQDDLKFTEVVAATLRSLREVRWLQRRHAGLSQFFSPIVLDALATEDPDVVLAPREAEVSVLFCDLRGFSRESEKSADNLLGLLQRVSRALGVTTHQILAQGGVVGDFQGDAAMGFWGWPLPQDDAVERACLAALAIRTELQRAAQRQGDLLAGFRMGIGIATGNAVAGKIGTVDQVKVTVFGPVVNLASRLEGMTKTLRAPILLDEPTAHYVRTHVPTTTARCRRLAVVQPMGLDTPVEISELLPPLADFPSISDQHLADYEAALDALQAGAWSEAFELLHRVPASDRVKDFLTGLIAQHHRTPPPNWDGVIRLTTK